VPTAEPSWIVRPRPHPSATLRLLCVPYAGAGVAAFAAWTELLGSSVDLAIVRLPGRESRIREPFCRSAVEAAELAAGELAALTDLPLALFGHSMGAIIAFEIARRLRQIGMLPVMLAVSGWRAPSLPGPLPRLAHLPVDEFALAIQDRFGAVPRAVLEDRELLSLLIPTLRADVGLVEQYGYRGDLPLSCPIAAYGGDADPHATESDLRQWGRETSGAHHVRMFRGGHFFIQSARDEVLAHLKRDLAASLATPSMVASEP
jgi:medium-chain acyl-[acyl-carrier-protein] hydrolase